MTMPLMWSLALRRLFDAALVVVLVGTLAFVLLHIAPGDPISALLSDARVAPSVREHMRAVYALDQPIFTQYARYVGALATGDLGYSFSQSRPVVEALRDVLPYSLLLMGVAFVASLVLGAVLGIWQAARATS